ncbi:MAG: VWA domain-containing protein, partial [Planctomycetota bacterium]
MTFLSPWSALGAAAITVPLLLLLYFLKLRRQTTRIASTLLWRRSTEDLQANVPLQRLRWSLLLLLQLLIAATLIAALGRPVVLAAGGSPARVILLIDRSASMNAADGGPGRQATRLEAAREAANTLVRRLGRRREPAEMMVVAFASTAQVISGFESNRAILRDAIEAVEPTDEEADLEAALDLAGAFASRDESADQPPPQVVLISDGGVGPPPGGAGQGFTLRAGGLRFVGIGPPPQTVDNVGIAAFSARRDYQDPQHVLAFARLVNSGAQALETTATLRVDGEAAQVKQVAIPAAAETGAGEAPVTFDARIPGAAVLTITSSHRDDLPADNSAVLILRPPAAPRIGLVHADENPDPFLVGLLEALRPQNLVVMPASASRTGTGGDLDLSWAAGRVDLVVLDRVSPAKLPPMPTLSFGAALPEIEIRPSSRQGAARILSWDRQHPILRSSRQGAARILSWDRQHPILRHVSLDGLVYAGFGGYDLPESWVPLALGPDGPVIAVGPTRAGRHVLVGFDLTRSNWPMDVSIAVFMHNVLNELIWPARGDAAISLRPGEPVTVRCRPEVDQISIEGPLNTSL